ncbi:MAG: nucleotide exchange factor GrpE [Bryobacteraceae bacterium]|jgi:molecular chaperone GrpE
MRIDMHEKHRPTESSAPHLDTPALEPAAPDGAAGSDQAALPANLTAERDQLAQERANLQDQLLRLRAEFENFRKRAQRERSEFAEFAAVEAVLAILPVLDDFERALKAGGGGQEFRKGIELVYQRLLETLKKMGLEPMESEGRKFDPALHHAVETERTDRIEDHTIVEEHQRGYTFKGKLLRPAMVKVAVHP